MTRAARAARWVPLVLGTALLAGRAIRGVLVKLGHPGAALDDAYIHFQYARAFAEGHPFRFQAGEPISTGATSFLWPFVLAPFYFLGFRDEAILWPAWALSFAALGALAYEAYALARPLAGRPAAIGAGAMTLAFGGFAWGAASGMEVVPFAWLMATSLRRAATWAEEPATRTRRTLTILLVLAVLCPLMRPEGAIIALAVGVVVATHASTWRGRADALGFFVAAIVPQLLLLLLTGHPTSSTAQVKLLFGNPYYVVADAALGNAQTLVGKILDGELWSAEFLPRGGAFLAGSGLAALAWQGHATNKLVRAGLVLLLALSMFVPCFYVTFLWNRLRYLWPFATGWLVGLACLARALATLAVRFDRRLATTSGLIAGVFAGAFLVRLDWVLEDVAQSASGIDRQQVALGRWAKGALPANARIGVNDTGAIAYFGDRKTFDIVGLTTPSEGRYWVAGAASRIEHYEKLPRALLPTHFIVYPEWMGSDAILGRALHDAIVTDATILGGQVMRASEARWDYLGSGEKPWTEVGAIVDELDVADLESEGAHGYELLGAREGEQLVEEGNAPDGRVVLDGGRTNRLRDRFSIGLAGNAVGIARVDATPGATIEIRVGERSVLRETIREAGWTELRFDTGDVLGPVHVEVIGDLAFSSFHYWFAKR